MPDWRTVQLHEVADIRVSNVDKKSVAGEFQVKLCNYMDVYGNDYIRVDLPFMEATATAVEIERFGVRRGDVMITKDSETPDDIGIPSVVLDDIESLVCGYHLAQLRPRDGVVDPTYLAKQLSLPETSAYFAQRATGSTRYGLSTRTIAQTPIRLAPLIEQQRIAAILTSLDTAIEATEALIEKHQQIKAGLMRDLFKRGVLRTGLLRPSCGEAPNLYVRSPLGHIPVDWSVKALDDLCSLIVDCPHSTPVFQESGVLVARTMHIKSGQFLEDEASRVSEREYQQRIERGAPQAGDLIFTREAPVGEAFVVPDGMRMCLGQRVMLIRPLTGCLEPTYLLHQLYSGSLSSQIRDRTAGTTNPHLNVADVRRLLVPVPPLAEQAAIASSLSSMTQRILADQQTLKKLRMQKQGLMQDLLTGKVPVRAD